MDAGRQVNHRPHILQSTAGLRFRRSIMKDNLLETAGVHRPPRRLILRNPHRRSHEKSEIPEMTTESRPNEPVGSRYQNSIGHRPAIPASLVPDETIDVIGVTQDDAHDFF